MRGVSRYVLERWRADTLPVNAFLVEHPGGLLLFDTGQTAEAAVRGYLPRWHPFLRLSRFELSPEDEVTAQLKANRMSPREVRWVVLSHLHTDHVGGLTAFTGAEVLVSRIEWSRSTGVRGRIRGYVPQHWPPSLVPSLLEIDGPPVGPFPRSYDVAGDGRLMVVPTPGHTPGHIGLIVRGDGSYFLGGDVAHDRDELERLAPGWASWCREEEIVFLGAHDPGASTLTEDGAVLRAPSAGPTDSG